MASEGRTRYATIAATCTAALLIAQQVAAKAVRDAYFLSHFDSASLLPAMAAAAVIGIGSALVVGRMMVRRGPARYVPWLFGLQSVLFTLEYAASAFAPAQVAVVLYLHVAALAPVLASAFWSAVNEQFSPYTAKRVIGRIGAGATFGGVLGGLATARFGHTVSITSVLLGIAALNLLALAGALVLRGESLAESRPAPQESGLAVLRRTPYLRDLAALVVLLAVTDSWLDYVFKAEAGGRYGSGESLLGFFALFYTATAILTFGVQVLLNRYALRELGLGGAVAALPGAVLFAGAASVAAPGLGSAGLLRGLSAVVESSLYRSGYELLYTPLPAAAKRATKAVLDVAMSRIGTVLGSGVALAAVAFVPGHAHRLLLSGCVVLSVGALLLALRLHAGYVAQLAASLRTGVVRLDSSLVLDGTTMRTLNETAGELDRAELLRRIEAARARPVDPLAVAPPSTTELPPRTEPHSFTPPANADLSERALALSGSDRESARRALRPPLAPELTGLALRWLSDDALAHAVHAALEPLSARSTGQLLDSLLDPAKDLALRRRLPRLLGALDGERVERGLFAALDDPSFEIRERCAQALSTIAKRKGASVLSEAEILGVIDRELTRGEPPLGTLPPPSDNATASRGGRSISLVFTLLGLCFERGAVALCLQAILGPDSQMRGTALEYLDNVLPGPIRDKLWPRLRVARSERPRRSRHAIVQELLSASQSEQVTRARLPPRDG